MAISIMHLYAAGKHTKSPFQLHSPCRHKISIGSHTHEIQVCKCADWISIFIVNVGSVYGYHIGLEWHSRIRCQDWKKRLFSEQNDFGLSVISKQEYDISKAPLLQNSLETPILQVMSGNVYLVLLQLHYNWAERSHQMNTGMYRFTEL